MSPDKVGMVLAGGGARGAYEAGALSVLLPSLELSGHRPSMLFGTSVGAVNAAFLAGDAHLDATAAGAALLERWREATKSQVLRPILLQQVPLAALRYAGELLSVPGVRLPSLLDPKPLAGNLARWVNWNELHRNVDEGRVDVLSIVATAARTGRSVAFCEGQPASIAHRSHVIDYAPARIGVDHVRASAAIPILFPPVRVEDPPETRGWYFDGGTRLNTPIKPALDLGADRLVVIATDSIAEPSDRAGRHECEPPDLGDGVLHLLKGTLVDPLVEDLRRLGNVNASYTEKAPGARRDRKARGKDPYRLVPYTFVAPARPGEIGEVATEVMRSRYGGVRSLRSPDFPLLSRLLGHEGPSHGELLSYLLFDGDFIDELLEMGRRDARRCLDGMDGPEGLWRTGPLDAFLA